MSKRSVSLQKTEKEARWIKALELRRAGRTYEFIAGELGFSSPASASQAVKSALNRFGMAAADEVRALELERLDRVVELLWPRIEAGDDEALNLYFRAAERRAKLCGLDVSRQEVKHSGQANQTLVMIGGDGQSYIAGLKEMERHLKAAESGVVHVPDSEIIDVPTQE